MKTKTNQEWLEEFHKIYDFSEGKTLEYNNLVGIGDFLLKALEAKDELARLEKIELVEYIKNEYGDFSETQCCGDYDLIDYLEEDPKLTQLKAGQEADSERAKSRPEAQCDYCGEKCKVEASLKGDLVRCPYCYKLQIFKP